MKRKKTPFKLLTICLAFSMFFALPLKAVESSFDDDKPDTNYDSEYSQEFSSWDNDLFYSNWVTYADRCFSETDITEGYLQFAWVPKRIMKSLNNIATPYIFETDMDYSAGSSRAGMVIRVSATSIEELQDQGSDPGFNREGIAIFPTDDGLAMNVKFSGVEAGAATDMIEIQVPKPADVTTLRDKANIRVEDFGSTIYVYYNNAPFFRVDLSDSNGSVYSSGVVYDANMTEMGTFTGMEVEVMGKIAIAQRDAALRLYGFSIKTNTNMGDMLTDKPEADFGKTKELSFDSWDQAKFDAEWDVLDAVSAANIVSGEDSHLMLGWVVPRVLATKASFETPYSVELEYAFISATARGGLVLRVDPAVAIESLQEPGEILSPPLYNREGIALFPTIDGAGMNVQFSGPISDGDGYSTLIKRIRVEGSGVNMREKSTIKVEDFGESLYVFHNDLPLMKIVFTNKVENNYTGGTVYNAKLVPQGVFSGVEILDAGKIGMAVRDDPMATNVMNIYHATIKLPSTVSDVPTGLTATAGDAQASVAFTAPVSDGGSAITSYTLTSSPEGLTQTGTESPIIITGLTNGTEYTFTLTAINAIGESEVSEASNAVTPIAVTVPDAPTAVSASVENVQATVSFTAPVGNGGSEIVSYTVTSTPGDLTQTGTESPIVITGLSNFTSYTFTVTATNAIGNSVVSEASNEVSTTNPVSVGEYQEGLKLYNMGSSVMLDLNGLSGMQNVYVFSIQGKCVISRQSNAGEILDISSNLNKGIYVVKVQGNEKTLQTKFVVR